MRIIKHIVIYSLLLIATACNNDSTDGLDGQEGYLSFSMALSVDSGSSSTSTLLDNSVLRIYDVDNRLVRRYEPASEMPEYVYMVEGDYKVTVTVGDQTTISTSADDITYYGEEDFTITQGGETEVKVECSILNTMVEVVFDETIDISLNEGYYLQLYNGDSYDESDLKMTYTESGVGYFIVPDGDIFKWDFVGSKESSGQTVSVTKSGVITTTGAQNYNTLTFTYSVYLNVSSLNVVVNESLDEFDDDLNFKPQPSISPINFSTSSGSFYPSSDITLSVTALQNLSTVEVTAGNSVVRPFEDGSVASVSGASYEIIDSQNGTLTLSPSLFDNYEFGGENEFTVTAWDVDNTSGELEVSINVSGITTMSDFDFWDNTGRVSALVLEDTTSQSVEIEYREAGATTWYKTTATAGADNSYSVELTPVWSDAMPSQNSYGQDVYQLIFGVSPQRSYEYRLTVGTKTYPTATITIEDEGQEITYGTLVSGLDAYSSDNASSSSTHWTSGNNTYAEKLCSYGFKGGVGCAYLVAAEAGISALNSIKLAAGNIVYGQFSFSGTAGTVSFGQSFDWSARPRSLKVDYATQLGVVGTYSGTQLSSGATDRARIYMAIVNWSSRRDVEAGISSTKGIWDPEDKDSANSSISSYGGGDIIGYASLYIDESTSGDGLHAADIEVFYFDKETKPSSSNITLVLNAATCAYGDYFVGSEDSKMWVQNFRFGY